MRFLAISFNYLVWHYGRAIFEFSHIYKNILGFLLDFFSIPVLLRTFFAPWRRMGEEYSQNIILHFEEAASVFVVNLIMRLMGIVMRTIIIAFGLIILLLAVILYPVLIIIWLLLPLILIVLIMLGFGLLFR